MGVLQGIRAARPEVLHVAKELRICHWGTLATFVGTPEQLIGAAGVAYAWMFEDLGKTGVKTAPDGYGNQYCVQRGPKAGIPKGAFELKFYLREEPAYGDSGDERTRKLTWWREYGDQVDAEVARVLRRMRRPRKASRVR
jgi:hypothetical protein